MPPSRRAVVVVRRIHDEERDGWRLHYFSYPQDYTGRVVASGLNPAHDIRALWDEIGKRFWIQERDCGLWRISYSEKKCGDSFIISVKLGYLGLRPGGCTWQKYEREPLKPAPVKRGKLPNGVVFRIYGSRVRGCGYMDFGVGSSLYDFCLRVDGNDSYTMNYGPGLFAVVPESYPDILPFHCYWIKNEREDRPDNQPASEQGFC